MSKKQIIQIIVILLVLVNSVVLGMLWWKQSPNKQKLPSGSAKEYLAKELAFTQQQQANFDLLRQEHLNGMKDLRDETREAKESLFEYVSADVLDSTAVKEALQRVGNVEMKKDQLTLDHFRKVRKMLTPDQQKKFDTIIKDVMRMMSRQQAPGMQPGPGGDGRRPPPDRHMNDQRGEGPPPEDGERPHRDDPPPPQQ